MAAPAVSRGGPSGGHPFCSRRKDGERRAKGMLPLETLPRGVVPAPSVRATGTPNAATLEPPAMHRIAGERRSKGAREGRPAEALRQSGLCDDEAARLFGSLAVPSLGTGKGCLPSRQRCGKIYLK